MKKVSCMEEHKQLTQRSWDKLLGNPITKLNKALIVVDAWRTLPKVEKSFGGYINSILEEMRDYYSIYHCADNRPIMEEIDCTHDKIISSVRDPQLTLGYDKYYFMGFHIGKCVNMKAKELKQRIELESMSMGIANGRINLVFNLSLPFQTDQSIDVHHDFEIVNYLRQGKFINYGEIRNDS